MSPPLEAAISPIGSQIIQLMDDAGPEINAVVQEVQQALNRLPGETPLRMDGVFDVQTSEALRRFQSTHGLDATGAINQPTIDVLNQFAPPRQPAEEVPAESFFPTGRIQEQSFAGALTRARIQEGAKQILDQADSIKDR